MSDNVSKFYKSFSGTDTLAFIMMPGCVPVVIGSLTTISYSMFRNKKPVINIGRTNINGVTRGSRIFAGTMIFTLINQHWLKELQEQIPYIKKFENLKVDELPLFDIMIISANEYGNAVSMYIYGIDYTDEAQTISVEDLFTENTFSFVARDISNFHKISYIKNQGSSQKSRHEANAFTQRLYVLNSSNVSFDDIASLEREMTLSKIEEVNKEKRYTLSRELYYSTTRVMMGNDVTEIQEILKRIYNDTDINGVFDEKLDKIVRRYQSDNKLPINGIVDDRFYTSIMNSTQSTGERYGTVINKDGAFVYRYMSMHSDIVDTYPYKNMVSIQSIETTEVNGVITRWYKVNSGYVLESDIYSSYYIGNILEFPIIKYGDVSNFVTIIQNALCNIFPNFSNTSGEMDEITVNTIKQLQSQYGLLANGVVDSNTWNLLQSLSGNITNDLTDDGFRIINNIAPGVYKIQDTEILSRIALFYSTITCNNYINVKMSAVATYKNNKTVTKSSTYNINNQILYLEEFRNLFVYNPSIGAIPNKVEYVIYPYGKRCYKWTVIYE